MTDTIYFFFFEPGIFPDFLNPCLSLTSYTRAHSSPVLPGSWASGCLGEWMTRCARITSMEVEGSQEKNIRTLIGGVFPGGCHFIILAISLVWNVFKLSFVHFNNNAWRNSCSVYKWPSFLHKWMTFKRRRKWYRFQWTTENWMCYGHFGWILFTAPHCKGHFWDKLNMVRLLTELKELMMTGFVGIMDCSFFFFNCLTLCSKAFMGEMIPYLRFALKYLNKSKLVFKGGKRWKKDDVLKGSGWRLTGDFLRPFLYFRNELKILCWKLEKSISWLFYNDLYYFAWLFRVTDSSSRADASSMMTSPSTPTST